MAVEAGGFSRRAATKGKAPQGRRGAFRTSKARYFHAIRKIDTLVIESSPFLTSRTEHIRPQSKFDTALEGAVERQAGSIIPE